MTIRLNVANKFTPFPMGRYREDGKRSAQVFREDILLPKILHALQKNDILELDFNGMKGINPSFMREAFCALVSKHGLPSDDVLKVLRFSSKDPYFQRRFEKLKDLIRATPTR